MARQMVQHSYAAAHLASPVIEEFRPRLSEPLDGTYSLLQVSSWTSVLTEVRAEAVRLVA